MSVTHGQCDARPAVTFPANGRYQFILLGEQRHIVCEQLAQSRYVKRSGRDSNLRPLGCKSDALTTTPPRHAYGGRSIKLDLWWIEIRLRFMGLFHCKCEPTAMGFGRYLANFELYRCRGGSSVIILLEKRE